MLWGNHAKKYKTYINNITNITLIGEILSEKLQRNFKSRYIGTVQTALFEKEKREGYLLGFTDNYIKVKIPFEEKIRQCKKQIKLSTFDKEGIINAQLIN